MHMKPVSLSLSFSPSSFGRTSLEIARPGPISINAYFSLFQLFFFYLVALEILYVGAIRYVCRTIFLVLILFYIVSFHRFVGALLSVSRLHNRSRARI